MKRYSISGAHISLHDHLVNLRGNTYFAIPAKNVTHVAQPFHFSFRDNESSNDATTIILHDETPKKLNSIKGRERLLLEEDIKSSFDISFRFYGTRISISFRSKNGSIFISGIEIINQNRSDSLERSNITDAIIS